MQQLTMTADRQVEWWDVPEPALQGAGEALVRPLAVALCDLDQPILRGEAPIPGPIAIGHEFVAEVTRGRRRGARRRAGRPRRRPLPDLLRRVRALPARADRRLHERAAALDVRLRRLRRRLGRRALGPRAGALRRRDARRRARRASRRATLASASDNIPDGWRTVAPHLAERPGADVLVVGGGGRSIALYAVDAARALGAGRVVYADVDAGPPRGRRRARRGGRGGAAGRAPYGEFPITVDASGVHAGLHAALRSTEPGGVCTSIGIYYGC